VFPGGAGGRRLSPGFEKASVSFMVDLVSGFREAFAENVPR
jgi:hypothetical protein